MRSSSFLWATSALSVCLAGPAQGQGTWNIVPFDYQVCPGGECQVTVGAEEKTVEPGCALGTPYSFHFKDGKHDKLLVFFNGGGACWDSNTCVGSLSSEQPTYVPYAEIANNPAGYGGILDPDNPANPYADWSMLFISYCTGDVHVGSVDTSYNGFTIYHRGFDNFLYAMDWLKTHHPDIDPRKVFIAGSSAGSYGTVLNVPWVHEFYPDADKFFVLADGGVGVFTGAYAFGDAVFGEPSVWNLSGVLHPAVAAVLDNVPEDQAERFIPEVYNRLRSEYPKTKFAQYTTAYDAIQILVWDIMLNTDTPWLWGQGLSNPFFVFGWNSEMRAIDEKLRLPPSEFSLPDNYRSYIGPGCNHTIMRYSDAFYTSSLTSSSLEEITFLQWLTAMTGEKGRDKANWENLSCAPGVDCGEADLTTDGVNACLNRTLGQQ